MSKLKGIIRSELGYIELVLPGLNKYIHLPILAALRPLGSLYVLL
jgi:hypothetical protein